MGQSSSSRPTPGQRPNSPRPVPHQQFTMAPRSHVDPTGVGPGLNGRTMTWRSRQCGLHKDPIIEEWRTTPLHYVDRTDCDRPHLPTIPNLTTEVRPRCSRRNQGREGERRERGREGERGRRWAYCLNELPCI
ncbi:hypothetical protein BHE74_00016304 [Ensete ventricosum]|nr:hypothetical protein BHE74_00016304 [Ensete ventricosum]